MTRVLQPWLSLLLVALLASAAGPSIGVAIARGSFRVDSSSVRGNTTLFDGSAVETARVASEFHLQNGVRLSLASASLCRVYHDRLVLERGQGRIDNAAGYRIEALGLRILPAAAARVALTQPGLLQVAALSGPVRVATAGGIVLADLAPGRTLEFQPQPAGAVAASTLTGVLLKKDGRFLLTDETSGVTLELLGPGLDNLVGARVEVTGTIDPAATAAPGASQVLRVLTITVLERRPPAPAAAPGMSGGKKAIIAGVVVAAVATGAGIAATRGKEEKRPISP